MHNNIIIIFLISIIQNLYRCGFNEGDKIVSNQLIDNVGISFAHYQADMVALPNNIFI